MKCKKCYHVMIRASLYDPDGIVPLHGGIKEYEGEAMSEWWVCINPGCSEGVKNLSAAVRR